MATKTKPIDLEAAVQEAAEAVKTADRMEAEMRAGDLSISPSDVREARTEAEDLVLRLESAKAAKAREEREDLEQRGTDLHARFVEDQTAAFETVEQKIVGFAQAAGALLDSLDFYDETREGYKRRWNEVFRGNTDLPAALKFKAGGKSGGGDFGALDHPYTVARSIPPLQTVVAVLGEVITRYPKNPRSGIDREIYGRLTVTGHQNGLKSLRELRKQLDKQKEKNK